MALLFDEFRIEKSLRRRMRQNDFLVTFDQDLDAVIRACAEPRPGRLHLTWITPDVIKAYSNALAAGLARSVEVWDRAGNLTGGAYGLESALFTESQFTRQRDASKIGFAVLNCHLRRWGYLLNDGKQRTTYLTQLGQVSTPCWQRAVPKQVVRPWVVDPSIDVAKWNPADGAGPLGNERPL
jgi:leucyl/phenylalanyl-tRNA--protein transferase